MNYILSYPIYLNVESLSKNKLRALDDEELFEIARNRLKFRELMIDFIYETGIQSVEGMIPELELNIRKLGFSERTKNVLCRNDIEFLTDLTVVKKKELLRMPNLGKGSLDEIVSVMNKYGLRLLDG